MKFVVVHMLVAAELHGHGGAQAEGASYARNVEEEEHGRIARTAPVDPLRRSQAKPYTA
jgi:hypothetical protein